MTANASPRPRLNAYSALCEGVRRASEENAAIGGIEQLRAPDDYVAASRKVSGARLSIPVHEYLERRRAIKRDPGPHG